MNYEFLTNSVNKSGIKKMEFYRLIGVTAEGFRGMIDKKTMKVETLEKIAEVLNIPIIAFFSENTETNSTANDIAWMKQELERLRKKVEGDKK